jgi:sulfur dioxygenase
MLVRQLFNHPTFSYTYLLADPISADAVLIDPVKGKLREYVQLFNELGLTAVAAIDTHYHDDHISALNLLSDLWGCEAIAGAPNDMPGITREVEDGDIIRIGAMQLNVIHTPGHSDNSYCFQIEQPGKSAIFTGDTLLVRTVGLSNQATSNPRMHYDSLYNVLATLPDTTLVYPGRDFKGWPLSTIGEEKAFNPYLQAPNMEAFLQLKRRQKPADIIPLVKVEEEEEDTAVLAAVAGKNAVVGNDSAALDAIPEQDAGDFFLADPVEDAVPPAAAQSAAAPRNPPVPAPAADSSAKKPAADEDKPSVPSWR